ncbi:MAG: SCO family protein [Candidatus Magnetobacterium sp. LHC-1]|uniref:SCO family protein n=1 Tax=Candidatus Magnetobacterium casense TaxID=1455061 RepID=A0ABS6RUX5_9BACT|nr:SCO family protein [Candidatus Magnetobacterium casensis]MBF0606798.1 SCO family protein [Nitrospirota bacterium]MBV6340423.1 SCO family protein [Candidatus Magnetobacterium casensis]
MKTLLLSLALIALTGTVAVAAGTVKKLSSPNEALTLGKNVPNVTLIDSHGKQRTLMEIIGNKPLVISLIYIRCETACLLITDSLMGTVEKVGDLGKGYNVLTLSFDHTDTPEMLAKFATTWQLDRPGWTVVTGEEKELEKLLKAIDFSYRLDEETGDFIHPNLLVLLTPTGKISKYIYGVNYNDRDLKLSIIAAKQGSSSASLTEGLLLWCYQYDPLTGSYKLDLALILEVISGLLFFISVVFFFFGRQVISSIRSFAGKLSVRHG